MNSSYTISYSRYDISQYIFELYKQYQIQEEFYCSICGYLLIHKQMLVIELELYNRLLTKLSYEYGKGFAALV